MHNYCTGQLPRVDAVSVHLVVLPSAPVNVVVGIATVVAVVTVVGVDFREAVDFDLFDLAFGGRVQVQLLALAFPIL